jgi:hypothetical protein
MMSSDKPRMPPPSAEGVRRCHITSTKTLPSESNLIPAPLCPSACVLEVDSIPVLAAARPEADGDTTYSMKIRQIILPLIVKRPGITFEYAKDGSKIGGVWSCLDEGDALVICSLWSMVGLKLVGLRMKEDKAVRA